jgi:hypothetical protein
MKKILLSLSLVCTAAATVSAQATATNFTATDCNSISHTLFNELDNGKVVVLAWVMPCGSCIAGAKGAWDAAQSFATSNPGKVIYYMADDLGNASCATLNSWATTNSIGPANLAVFSNAGKPIDEANYGGTGMPHIVVMAGTDHKIYFNEFNGAATGIMTAINNALVAVGINDASILNNNVKVYPNPATKNISVAYTLEKSSDVTMTIYNLTGAAVKSVSYVKQNAGKHEASIDFENSLANGTYMLKLTAGSNSKMLQFTVAD